MHVSDSSSRPLNLPTFLLAIASALLLICPSSKAGQIDGALSDLDAFPYVVGTQTIGPAYQFTSAPKLIETADAIRAMGSNTLKFALRPEYFGTAGNIPQRNPAIHTLTELVRDEPSHRHVLDMPFANYLMWAYCFTAKPWGDGFEKPDGDREYQEMYDLTRYLLTTYNGSGKTFYLGNWEGDWALLGHYDASRDPDPSRIRRMIDWLTTRQRAVDDAKRDTPHEKVNVYHYVEVNLVLKGMGPAGRSCVTNDVLPRVNVDYVSYSAYDSLGGDIDKELPSALAYIESKLPAKAPMSGKRVFIGEYGFPAAAFGPELQDRKSRQVMVAAMKWGCPFILYWAMYNNEVNPGGKQAGFWLIDNRGVKQPIYQTHRRYLDWARQFVADTGRQTGKLPTDRAFRAAACAQITQLP